MRRTVVFSAIGLVLVGCGGSDSSMNSGGAGLYGMPARDARERDSLVSNATKELAKGPASKVADAAATFGFKLLGELKSDGNVVVSPLSISSALAMTLNGAAGSTQKEMLDTLGYQKMPIDQVNEASRSMRTLLGNVDPLIELRVANSIWTKQGEPFKPEFLQLNDSAYGAKTNQLDFSDPGTVDSINRWVKDATSGKIERMVDAINRDSVMFLLNAVYFKGQWQTPFVKGMTKAGTFTSRKGEKRTVSMMGVTSGFGYAEDKGWKAVALPYGNGRVEMLVVVPDDLQASLKALGEKGLPKNLATMAEAQVSVKMPKFKVDYSETLNESLQKLGIKQAFTDQADFSAMSPNKLMISTVRHKTYIDVDEVGTEAAASTSVEMVKTAAPANPKSFVVDKPFYFAIREKQTGIVLFVGAIRSIGEAAVP